jgi:hypothetical protein
MSYIRWSTEGTSGKWYIYGTGSKIVGNKSIKMQQVEILTMINNGEDEVRTQHLYHDLKRNWDNEIEFIKKCHGKDYIEEVYVPLKRFIEDCEENKKNGKLFK